MLRRAREQAVAAVRAAGRASRSRRTRGCRSRAALGVPEQQLEQRRRGRRVSHSPAGVRLAEAELAARRERGGRTRGRGSCICDRRPAAEAPRACRRAASPRACRPRGRASARSRIDSATRSSSRPRARGGSRRSVRSMTLTPAPTPRPARTRGLRWNGTRFSQSRSACQWISAIDLQRHAAGSAASSRASDALVSSRRRPCSTAVSGRAPSSSRTWIRAQTSSPGCENAYS